MNRQEARRSFFIRDNVCTPYKLILNRISRFLRLNGWDMVLQQDKADIIIIGGCAAFHSLENESIEFIRNAREQDTELVIFGCLTGVSPEKVKSFNPDRIISAPGWEQFEYLIDQPKIALKDIDPSTEFRLKEEYRLYDPGKQFVLLQTGCSSNCPYCPHKLGIGVLKSRPKDEIIRQVKELVEQNVHTIILTGNDTGSYGTDNDQCTYPELLSEILEISPSIHLSQLNANWVYQYRRELACLVLNPKIKDFQVLIQTTSDRLLELMDREPVVKKLEPFLTEIRQDRPDLVLRTDIMIGFPTATEEEEQETLEFVAKYFDEVAVHAFERFEHAPIEKMGLDFYSQEEIDKRTKTSVKFLNNIPGLLVHRGGQVYQTLVDIEKPKEDMRRIKDAKPMDNTSADSVGSCFRM